MSTIKKTDSATQKCKKILTQLSKDITDRNKLLVFESKDDEKEFDNKFDATLRELSGK